MASVSTPYLFIWLDVCTIEWCDMLLKCVDEVARGLPFKIALGGPLLTTHSWCSSEDIGHIIESYRKDSKGRQTQPDNGSINDSIDQSLKLLALATSTVQTMILTDSSNPSCESLFSCVCVCVLMVSALLLHSLI
jgi:hypothetical protein